MDGDGPDDKDRKTILNKKMLAAIESLTDKIDGFQAHVEKLSSTIKDLATATEEHQLSGERMLKTIKELTCSTKERQVPDKKLLSAIEDLAASIKERQVLDEKFVRAINELTDSAKELRVPDEKLSSSIEKIMTFTEDLSITDKELLTATKELQLPDKYDMTLNRAALEAVDGKPAFTGLIRFEHCSGNYETQSVWQGITLHAHDRPFTVRVLMQHIQTTISNLHPEKPTSGIELMDVSFIWDNMEIKNMPSDAGGRVYHIQGRGGADESVRENALVSDSLETMMARGVRDYIYVRYRLDKVDHAEWCGPEMRFEI
ncbi:hypothetical protein DSL72_001129 [Monilinia vaccinii-corymbosi]|uniref:Uncharacterized protein n=1 Tax=Monilinia vaccinii-corymbosi TaxID=61207 RepID=A0A8A3P380_9HELO|nr:hypothetical protein DSL72_001129 [Monilinia vaccinii-corymbosi]